MSGVNKARCLQKRGKSINKARCLQKRGKSTHEQTTSNQKLEIQRAGFNIDYWYEDVGISGKTSANQRPQFSLLVDKIRDGESIVVSKLDRLGRDAIDILSTVKQLSERNIKVIVLQLGNTDLISTTGKLLLTMLSAVAEMERSIIVERTQAGLARAKSEGKKLGRKSKTTDEQKREIRQRLFVGESVSSISRNYGISRATVVGIRNHN
jgi:putative DNA-invertase from lambdoid prophage Rac